MEAPSAGDVTLEALMAVFNRRIAELQELMIIRGAPAGMHAADLGEVDTAVVALEYYMGAIKAHLRHEAEALPKAKAIIEMSSQQQRSLQHILANLPARLPGSDSHVDHSLHSSISAATKHGTPSSTQVETSHPKEKKARGPPPRWYVSVDELSSISSYMRGRLTLDKLNTAVDEMATFAEGNARLLSASRNKLGDDALEKLLELRDIAALEGIKGKYFFLETDMRGQLLKLDHTGKSILMVLRHLGRIHEVRTGRQRVFSLQKA